MIREIAGRNNDSVKLAAKLQKKKYRRERGLFVTEGFDLLLAGLDAGEDPVEVLVREDLLGRLPDELLADAREDELDIAVCSAEILARASGLGGAADVITVFPMPEVSLSDLSLGLGLSVYLAGVGDPGNVGTVIRSAAAFGAGGVALAPHSADPYSPKALRAGMGAHFVLPVIPDVSPADLRAKLAADAARDLLTPTVVLADPTGEEELRGLALGGAGVIVLGSEREGLEAFEAAFADAGNRATPATKADAPPGWAPEVRRVAISQAAVDSLNVAMAGTILLYELSGLGGERDGGN